MYTVKRSIQTHPLWKSKPPALPSLDIELTERCSNNCLHCYINLPAGHPAAARELTTAGWQDVLTQAADLGALSVRITGGEPLLRPDFPDIYLHARRLGLKVALYTNARHLTPQLAALLAKVPPLEKIEVSVYGLSPRTYDAVTRSPGAFAEFERGIQLLRQHGLPFLVKSVLLPQLEDEVSRIDDWARQAAGMDEKPGFSMFFDLRARRDAPAQQRLIRRLRMDPQAGVDFIARRSPGFVQGQLQFCQKFMGPSGDRLFTCGAGKSLCVDAYGQVQPCMLLRDPALVYELRRGSLASALQEVPQRLKDLRAANPAYLERCARCMLKGLCEQCPAKSWMEHGTLDTPVEYLCQAAHAQAVYLGLLEDGEKAWQVADPAGRLKRLQTQPEAL